MCVWRGIPCWENFLGEDFLFVGRNLRRSDFDHSNLFQSLKQHSVNTEHWLKSKLAWPVFTNSMKLNKNGTGMMTTGKNFYWVITWKLLFSGGNGLFVRGSLLGVNSSRWEEFLGSSPQPNPTPQLGKTL